MFEWLEAELELHGSDIEVDGPATPELSEAVESSNVFLPRSYKTFVLRFGNAKFYRHPSYYAIEIYASPREAVAKDGTELLQVGRTVSSMVYFKRPLLIDKGESPLFEWCYELDQEREAADFESWLRDRCQAERSLTQPAGISGIKPFTLQDLAIIEARKKFSWRVVGINGNNELEIAVHNGSNLVLPYLTLKFEGRLGAPRHGSLLGRVAIRVKDIPSGATKTVTCKCYKNQVDQVFTVLTALDDPTPEERDRYWEFR